jgi:hypothetical protein
MLYIPIKDGKTRIMFVQPPPSDILSINADFITLEQVGGELRVPKYSLKWGAFLGIAITTLLYTLVTVIYVRLKIVPLMMISTIDIR